MLTTLLNKFISLEQFFLEEGMDRDIYERVNTDIKYLYGYIISYENYILLSKIKNVLIPKNTRVDWALSPVDKWVLLLVYKKISYLKLIRKTFLKNILFIQYVTS